MAVEETLNKVDQVANLQFGSAINGSSVLDYLSIGVEAAIILGALGFVLYMFLNYKTKIPVMKITRTGYKYVNKRVKLKKEKGGSKFRYHIFMTKKTVPVTDKPNQIYIEDLKGNLTPADVDREDNLVKVKPASLDFWLANQILEANSVYKPHESFWDKNKNLIVSFVLITFAFVAILLILEQLADITSGLQAVASAFKDGKIVLSVPSGR